jgi:hypothetical protein
MFCRKRRPAHVAVGCYQHPGEDARSDVEEERHVVPDWEARRVNAAFATHHQG